METIQKLILICRDKYNSINNSFDFEKKSKRIEEIDDKISDPNIWNDQKFASSLMKERQKLDNLISKNNYFNDQISFYEEMIKEIPEEIESQKDDIIKIYNEISDFEFKQIMFDPIYDNPVILTINSGAGGLEAANWVTMLSRMYIRWANINNFDIEILDQNPSEEHSSICTDSISLRFDGKYAYGYLKSEIGVHRLIRNSPFNSADARHTSFAAISVLPDVENTIDIKIEDKDIEIISQTAGGKGGQNVNRVQSAIRLKHIPTGINILVRTERDQLANKKTAFKMLKAKLYEIERKKQQSEYEKILESQLENKFGSQIRTYTMSPYSLTKDHRTNFEIKNTEQVLDGDIQEFMISYLKFISYNN